MIGDFTMSTTNTTTQRIETLQEKIQQLENQKKLLLQKQRADERKARTRRLIQRGAILESLIPNAGELTNEQIKSVLERTVGSSYGRKIIDSVAAQNRVSGQRPPEPTAQGTD